MLLLHLNQIKRECRSGTGSFSIQFKQNIIAAGRQNKTLQIVRLFNRYKIIIFVALQFASLSLFLREERKVRATQSTILLNGKLFAKAE